MDKKLKTGGTFINHFYIIKSKLREDRIWFGCERDKAYAVAFWACLELHIRGLLKFLRNLMVTDFSSVCSRIDLADWQISAHVFY